MMMTRHISQLGLALLICVSTKAQSTFNTVIDPSVTYQTINDFGASDCWTADYIGKYFSDATKEQSAKWLFSQNLDSNGDPEGIGLSVWRVNLGAGSAEQGSNSGIDDATRRGYCYLGSDGTYNWTKSAGQQYFMQKAKSYGVDHFLLFSNSAPVQFTKNGKAYANSGIAGSNLKDDCYDDFAEFLATTTKHFIDEGYSIKYIDPVNEPQYDWTSGQEGSPWENSNIADLARQLDKSLKSRSLSTKILLPEAGAWNSLTGGTGRASNQIEAFFNNSNTSTYIGNLESLQPAVAGHSYWTFTTNAALKDNRTAVAQSAAKYNLQTMQTEWSMLDAAPSTETGFPASYDDATYMDIALFMGKLIYCDMVYANVSSWSYWTAFAQEKWGQKNRFYLVRINSASDTGNESYADINDCSTITDNSNLWVLGNYSFFIRPGYKRISLSGADDINSVMGTAYLSPDGTRIVAVYVNMNSTAKGVKMDLGSFNSNVSSIKKYITDETYNLKQDKTLSNTFSADTRIVLPKRSVVTIVLDLSTSGIEEVSNDNKIQKNNIYTIDGRLVKTDDISLDVLAKGIYIANGKKILVQ